jgi:hypothetical protein
LSLPIFERRKVLTGHFHQFRVLTRCNNTFKVLNFADNSSQASVRFDNIIEVCLLFCGLSQPGGIGDGFRAREFDTELFVPPAQFF